ncbi:MAG: hypothetical protein H8E25_11530 [Planctomycetes bacterium]|nr:hypothetical protein [Planctomycetota bacterium]
MLLSLSLSLILNCALLSVPQDQERVDEFTRIVFEADKVGDTKNKQDAMRRYRQDAILEYVGLVVVLRNNDALETERWVELFKEIWEDTYGTGFAKKYHRYIQRLSQKKLDFRHRLITQSFPAARDISDNFFKNKVSEDWQRAMSRATELVESFKTISDSYYLAIAHSIVANLYNPNYSDHENTDAQKAYDTYLLVMEIRQNLGLTQDRFFSNMKTYSKEVQDLIAGASGDGASTGGFKKKIAPETIYPLEGATAFSGTSKAIAAKSKSKVAHSADPYDEDYFSWLRGTLPAVGKSLRIGDPGAATLIKPAVNLVRVAVNKYQLEAGARPSAEFSLSGSEQIITVMRKHENGEEYPFSIEMKIGSTDSTYHGVKINLEPTAEIGIFFYRTQSIRLFDTDLGKISIYDTSNDGMFGYETLEVAWCEGLLPQDRFWRPDAIAIGSQKHSQPFNRYIVDKKGMWYEVAIDSHLTPTSLTLTPVQPKLGAVNFVYKGVKKIKPLSVLISSESSATKGLVIDLMALPEKKFIPIGRYKFLQARFGAKSGHEALILPGKDNPIIFTVSDDPEAETAQLLLGGKFEISAPVTLNDNSITVDGRGLHLVGESKERWCRFVGAPMFEAEFSVKGAKPVALATPTVDEVGEIWDRFFYPMAASLELRKPAAEVDVTLSYKKHPWFGNLKSTFTVQK